ncbi:ras-related and estrogen-regulated growth inhibitor [Aricia agestis]|uniref:ras-related and estrogen-regulated growth inhibitor n=1 Tax=Aricia agestis TaxID=91739 RepID=UPI001C20869F|nr:ras-related and estrogen-regulated growth inhibitor [Aricia agestis]
MSSTPSPKSSLAQLVLHAAKPKPFKVMVIGQSGVGKSALVVRFITRRFIGDYDPHLEKIYSFQTVIDKETVYFEILDSAGGPNESEYSNLESNIRWAEAFILMYSVTDKCSFDEVHRLKFLITYNKRRRRLTTSKDSGLEVPVVLVGNKADQVWDRMVTMDEGQRRSREIGCVCFHEISVRESIEQVFSVFRDVRRFWRVGSKCTRKDDLSAVLSRPLVRAASDAATDCLPNGNGVCGSRRWAEEDFDEEDEGGEARGGRVGEGAASTSRVEFRARASTDSRLPPRPARSRHPPPSHIPPPLRRMSIAMRGNNTNTF